MRIYIVINGPLYPESLGGSEIFAHSLATELEKRGHEVTMVGNLREDVDFDFPYKVVSLGTFRNVRSRLGNLLQIKKVLRKENLVGKKGSVLSVMAHSSLLGQVVKSLTGSSLHVLRFGGLDLDILTNPHLSPTYYLYSKAGLSIMDRRPRFVVMSRNMLVKATKLGIPREKCSVIPNLIEQRFFDVDPTDSVLRGYDVVFVGRLEKVKGVDVLLNALKYARRENPHVRLVIYGKGSLEKLVVKYKFIDFRGPLPYEEIHKAYRKATVFVLPSRYEGLPNSLLQAMASGLPVVATKVGGVPEIVKDRYNGLLVDLDPREISKAIIYLLENRNEALKMGMRARESVMHMTPDKVTSEYERVLNRVNLPS